MMGDCSNCVYCFDACCRRYAPTARDVNEDGYAMWPSVRDASFCGEWAPRPTEDEPNPEPVHGGRLKWLAEERRWERLMETGRDAAREVGQ